MKPKKFENIYKELAFYKCKFDNWVNKGKIKQKDGEEFRQCDGVEEPPFWFVSNQGYILSVIEKEPRKLKWIVTWKGRKNGNGYRWKVRAKHGGKNLSASKIVSKYFGEKLFDTDEETEIHHIERCIQFKPEEGEAANRADNLQILPRSVHRMATRLSTKSVKQYPERYNPDEQVEGLAMDLAANIVNAAEKYATFDQPYLVITNGTRAEVKPVGNPNEFNPDDYRPMFCLGIRYELARGRDIPEDFYDKVIEQFTRENVTAIFKENPNRLLEAGTLNADGIKTKVYVGIKLKEDIVSCD